MQVEQLHSTSSASASLSRVSKCRASSCTRRGKQNQLHVLTLAHMSTEGARTKPLSRECLAQTRHLARPALSQLRQLAAGVQPPGCLADGGVHPRFRFLIRKTVRCSRTKAWEPQRPCPCCERSGQRDRGGKRAKATRDPKVWVGRPGTKVLRTQPTDHGGGEAKQGRSLSSWGFSVRNPDTL